MRRRKLVDIVVITKGVHARVPVTNIGVINGWPVIVRTAKVVTNALLFASGYISTYIGVRTPKIWHIKSWPRVTTLKFNLDSGKRFLQIYYMAIQIRTFLVFRPPG